jgi:hypothetical protein
VHTEENYMEVNRNYKVDNKIDVRSEKKEGKFGDFKEFINGYNSISFSQHNPRVPKVNVPDEKGRQLCGQITGIIQELLNLPTLTDTDRRLLNLSSAVALLLSGGR